MIDDVIFKERKKRFVWSALGSLIMLFSGIEIVIFWDHPSKLFSLPLFICAALLLSKAINYRPYLCKLCIKYVKEINVIEGLKLPNMFKEKDAELCNECLEKILDGKKSSKKFNVVYHGLDNLNDDGFPYYTQWGYSKPVIAISNNQSSTMVKLTETQIMEFERYETGNRNLKWWDIHKRIEEIKEDVSNKVHID